MSDVVEPDEGGSEGPAGRPINKGAVLGGAVLGFVTSWLLFAVTVFTMYVGYGDSSTTTQTVIGVAVLLSIPAVSGALMISRRTRQWGAGLLMGVVIGSLTGAGICIATGM